MKKLCPLFKQGFLLTVVLILCLLASPVNAEPKVYFVQFTDYDQMDLNWVAVHTFVDSGIVKGFPKSQLRPDTPVTREQLAALISRAQISGTAPNEKSFFDLIFTTWSKQDIQTVGSYFTDILGGKSWFEPKKEMTKEEIYAVLVSANGLKSENVDISKLDSAFTDCAEISPKLKKLIAIAYDKKLIEADNSGKFHPKDKVKRSEAIGLVYREFFYDQTAFIVNGVKVSMGEFMFQRTQHKSLLVKQNSNAGRDFEVQNLIDESTKYAKDYFIKRTLAEQKATELGISLTGDEQKDIDNFIPDKIKEYGSEEEYQKHLIYNCMPQDLVLSTLKRDTLFEKVNQVIVKDIKASDEEVSKYYNDNMQLYSSKELFQTKQIVIKTIDANRNPLPEASIDAAKKKATEVASKAKSGEDFLSLVKQYSEDTFSVNIDGKLIFSKGDVEKDIEQAVSALKVGEISEPIKTSTAYVVLKLEEKTLGKVTPFEEVKENIRTFLTPKLQEKFSEETFKKWESAIKVELVGIK